VIRVGDSQKDGQKLVFNETSNLHFQFSRDQSLLALTPSFLARHQIKFYNITLSFKDCLGGDMMGNVVSISGFEVPVANGIMFSLRIGGFLKDDSNEFIYSWFLVF